MKELETSSNKKLTIVNFEKLKGCCYPAVATPSSFVFQLNVTDVSEVGEHYSLYVEYGSDELAKTHIKINRNLSSSPKGFDGYRIDIAIYNYDVHTYFVLANFENPNKFLRELSSYIKAEIETLPF
jgi:hypothetical protein